MIEKLVRLVLFARYPVAGNAKTRLIPAVGEQGAAKIHKILAQRSAGILSKAVEKRDDTQFILSFTGGALEDFKKWLAPHCDIITFEPQPKGDLTDRLLHILQPAPVIFFGSDTPDLTMTHVNDAINILADYDIVIGPALDGGYYLIGMNDPHDALLSDMPWSSENVLPVTLARCKDMGLRVHLLEPLSDCDMPEDLARWPWLRDELDNISL